MILSPPTSLAQGSSGSWLIWCRDHQNSPLAINLSEHARDISTKKNLEKKVRKNFFNQNFQKSFFFQNVEKTRLKWFLGSKKVCSKKSFFFFIFFGKQFFFKFFWIFFFFGFCFQISLTYINARKLSYTKIPRNDRLDAFPHFCEGFIEKYWKSKKLEPSTSKKKENRNLEKKNRKNRSFCVP